MTTLNFATVMIILASCLMSNPSIYAQNVVIPDANFKTYLLGQNAINTNGDAEIQISEAQAFNGMLNLNSLNIADLTGIESFTNLNTLYCSNNQLSTLNLSNNTALSTLSCNNNQLSSLNLSSNPLLTLVACNDNQLSSLNLSNNPLLSLLSCNNNQLSNLNIRNNTSITRLYCDNNQLSSLDLSGNTMLDLLSCNNNQLANLNLNGNIALKLLACNNNQLTNLNLDDNTAITAIACNNNKLSRIDLSNNTALMTLSCDNNQLTVLDLDKNATLTRLSCNNNQLSHLDLSKNTALVRLFCTNNQLISLNVRNGNNSNFTHFHANNNPNLTCIQVTDISYSVANWTNVDSVANFRTFCTVTGVTTTKATLSNVQVYPNPTNKRLTIALDKLYPTATITINNIMGQPVWVNNYSGVQNIDIDLEIANGVYFLSIETEEHKTKSIKFIKN
ncbi:T9SS type A sorting domain-containing protein [Aureispira anguillae]|uniref:T9SS type A sorting domain-containing protein n=1 Tax=Aureispira anguillae TaxID=2864201 RepID=A0A915YMD4_9BACT|nr:T9SS type A sorting domain-containing protein [Aureispira anguillae]BDS15607.1 T9SS type A sorting domain-containing protein [Aureispira anguillae]